MGRESLIQANFNAGELSPLMLARTDIAKRNSGLYTCLNGIPLSQGGWTRRPGTLFMKEAKFHNREARLFPFRYSITQTYVLEFGHQYIRFFTAHGILANTAQSITTVTQTDPAVLTKVSHGYSDGDRIYINNAVGMKQLNNMEYIVANKTADTFELTDIAGAAVDATAWDTFVSGDMAEVFEVASPYEEDDLPDIQVVQSADVLYILHPDYKPRTLTRVSALSWTLATMTFTDGPYDSLNTTTTTLTPSAATGTVTITASAVTGINNNTGFQTTDVGRLIRIQEGSTWGYCEITARASTVSVTAVVYETLTNTSAKVNWRLGIWSETTGWPRAATFFEDRLVMGGAAVYPQRIDFSRTGRYSNFSPSANAGTVADDNAVAFTMNSNDVNVVRWLKDNEKGLLVGTAAGEWQVRPSSLGEALTPTNVSGKPTTKHGSEPVQPLHAGKAILFVQRSGRKLRELAYVFEVDGFRAPDMSLLSEHITHPEMLEMAYMEQPQACAWITRSDGVLLGFTYEREQDVVGWHRHELGGQSDADALLIPVVESVAVVPSPDTTRDELYMIVQRYLNGRVARYVELMTKFWEDSDDQEDAFHVDCGWTVVNATPSATVPGLMFLEGETVTILADGAVHPPQVVANGKVVLDYVASVVTLGYSYNSDAVTMPVDGGAQDGSSQGKIKRTHRVGFWLLDTLGLKFGPSMDELTEILVRTWGQAMGSATPLFTGVYRDRFEGTHDRLGQIYWRCDGPFPATVLGVMPQIDTSDGS